LIEDPLREVIRVDLLSRASTWNGKSIALNFSKEILTL
jgi:hypothetical protein